MAEEDTIGPYELIPASDDEFTADDELNELFDPDEIPDRQTEDDPIPIGKNLVYDAKTGQFSAFWVKDQQAVVQVATVALLTKRGAHIMFDDDFGMNDPDAMIGHTADDKPRLAAYKQDITETLLACHERITAVGNFLFLSDPTTEEAELDLSIEIDGDTEIRLEGIPISAPPSDTISINDISV